MIRVILGTILGFWLFGFFVGLIKETDFYYSSSYNSKFIIIPLIIGALLGGYVGSKFNKHHITQLKAGRAINKNAENAGKSMVVFVILFLFSVLMSDVSGNNGTQYIFLLALLFLILAIFFAVKSIFEIRKTNEMGILFAILIIGLTPILLLSVFGPLFLIERG